MTRPLSDLLAGWETRARMLEENARREQSEQTARYHSARAAELRDCIAALEREVRAAAQAEAGYVMVPREALEGVLGSHSETDNDSGDEQCLSCYVILAAPRRTGVIYQDHEPDCDTVILRAALAQAQAGAETSGEGA